MKFPFSIPTTDGVQDLTIESGGAIIFVGANGGGKTRLAVHLENNLGLDAHRISAQRALNLNPEVPKISEMQARRGIRTGVADNTAQLAHRLSARWGSNAAVNILNDFDFLVQILFAEASNIHKKTHEFYEPGADKPLEAYQYTKFQNLEKIWSRLLPHRQLHISGDNILVSLPGSDTQYRASEMSDGERAIFYLIGQVLVADENIALIIDEPELHVHRSIMSKLWDELEAVRPDCGFIFITHDLEFAAARSAQKFVIRDYDPAPRWTIESVPRTSGFDEELVTLILGSRRPVLFVESDHSSLDMAIYRCCYPDWTVIPRGSCKQVIHSVVTLRKNEEFTRIKCSGLVDADSYDEEDKANLKTYGIEILPVSEIENMFLLPDVSNAIAITDGYAGAELAQVLQKLANAIFQTLNSLENIEKIVVRYCQRRIDGILKKIDLSAASSIADLEIEYKTSTERLDIGTISNLMTGRINEAIATRNLEQLLSHYDNKNLLAIASPILKSCKEPAFKNWLTRSLLNNSAPLLVNALSKRLPQIVGT